MAAGTTTSCTDAARSAFTRCLELWAQTDPDYPFVAGAQAHLAALEPQ